VPIVIDARLRPEGRFGTVVHSVAQYRDYFADRADTWERQALVKARPIAGTPALQADFMQTAHEAVYGRPFVEREAEEIRAMKRRIESERLRPADRATDMKLGHGGMSDIEFLTQLLQLTHGGDNEALRTVRTIDALDALADAAAMPPPEAARLSSSYRFLTRVRSRLALLTGQTVDTYPKDARRARALAIGFGTVDTPGRRAEEAFGDALGGRMQETRRIFERLFYEADRPGGRRP
jgi:glutamate-ammonia-ligase adenylyltransferase